MAGQNSGVYGARRFIREAADQEPALGTTAIGAGEMETSVKTIRLAIPITAAAQKVHLPRFTHAVTVSGLKIAASISPTSGTSAYALTGTLYRISADGYTSTTMGVANATASAGATTTPAKIYGADAAISDPSCAVTQGMQLAIGATTLVDDQCSVLIELTPDD